MAAAPSRLQEEPRQGLLCERFGLESQVTTQHIRRWAVPASKYGQGYLPQGLRESHQPSGQNFYGVA